MKQLTIREIQLVGDEILQAFHAFCKENKIKYSLCGGSLIGAIRHKGFIPWDDDVDIFMPRPEYDKFVRLFQDSEKYKLFTVERNNSYLPFARLCEMTQTITYPYTYWTSEVTGVCIDIFPIDGIKETEDEYKQNRAVKLKKLDNLMFQLRGVKTPFKTASSLTRFLKLLGKKVLYGLYDYDKYMADYQKLMKGDYENNDNCGQLSCPVTIYKEYQPKSWFEETIEVEFEGHKACVIAEYDKHLRHIFGNYMQLPPVEKQVPKHSEHVTYWRK